MTAQWSPHGRPAYGEPITVIRQGRLARSYFTTKRRGRIKQWYAYFNGFDDIKIRLEDEGLKWVRGHDGPQIDALMTAIALS